MNNLTHECELLTNQQSVFDREDLIRAASPIPLHSDGSLQITDSGDLCDADCKDCD